MKIGFIGLGGIGKPMAINIAKAGFDLTVTDLREQPLKELMQCGARTAGSPREVAEGADIVLASLPSNSVSEQVALGSDGVLAGAKSGDIYIELSTISPEIVHGISREALEKGVTVLDAPVSGGLDQRRDGTLAIMVGGDKDIFAKLRPVFDSLGDKVTYTGDVGSGTICKLMNNAFQFGMERLISESLTLGVKAGVSPESLVECMRNGGGGRGNILNVTLPETYFQGKFDPPRFKLRGASKDLSLALELA